MTYIANKCGVKLLPFSSKKMKDANVPRDISAEYNLSLLSSKNFSNDHIIKLNELQNQYLSKIKNKDKV